MKLYLVRHAEAETDPNDAKRVLSDRGKCQAQHLAEYFLQKAVTPKYIYHSGLVRAQQTAEIIANTLNVPTTAKIDNLDSSDDVAPIESQAQIWEEDTILVGHVPYMNVLLQSLTSGQASIGFHTATGACLERLNNRWIMQWYFHGSDVK